MSKFKKFLATSLLVVVSGFSYLGGAIGNIAKSLFSVGSASAASFNGENKNTSTTVQQGNVLSVKQMPTSVQLKNSVDILFSGQNANVSAKNGVGTGGGDVALTTTNLFVEIVDPYGASLTKWDDTNGMQLVDDTQVSFVTDSSNPANNVGLRITPQTSGKYKVTFHSKATNGVWTSTNTYTIDVSSISYELKMATNDAIVMPSSVNTEKTTTLDIALPLVYDEKGDLVTEEILLNDDYVVQYKDVAGENGVKLSDVSKLANLSTENTFKEYKTYTIKSLGDSERSAFSGLYKLNVSLNDSNAIKFADEILNGELNYGKYAMSFDVKNGDNLITYELSKRSNSTASDYTEVARLTKTVSGSTQYESDKIELVSSAVSTLDNFKYKEKVYLPQVTAVNANNSEESLEYFYYYVIKEKVDLEYKVTDNIVMGKDENGFYFIPQGDVGTSYNLAYKAVDSFGHVSKSTDYTKRVVDNTVDSYAITGSYNVADLNNEELVDTFSNQSYKIPTKIALDGENAKITIPAVWAYDKSGLRSLTRTLSSDSTTLISTGKTENDTEEKSGTFYITRDDGTTTAPSSIDLPFSDTTTSTRYKINDYIVYKALVNTSTAESPVWETVDVKEESVEGAEIGNLYYEKTTEAGQGAEQTTKKVYLYYRGSDGKYYKSTDGSNTKGTEISGNAEIRNFKNACDVELTLSDKIFEAGKYTISYYIEDNNSASGSVRKEFTFEIVEAGSLTATTPKVTFGDLTVSNVGAGQTVKVTAPTIKDGTDTRLLVKYYVVADNKVKLIKKGLASTIDTLSIDMNEQIGSNAEDTLYNLAKGDKSFKVVALAFNHFADSSVEYSTSFDTGATENKGIGLGEVTISVKNSSDSVAPTIETFTANTDQPEQNKEYTVSGMTFKDNSRDARVMVEIRDTNGRIYTDYSYNDNLSVSGPDESGVYTYTFGGIKFTPTNSDDGVYYTVTYKVIDKCDNVTALSFVLLGAKDKTPPVITLDSTSTRTVELGQTLDIQFEVKDNKTTDNSKIVNTVTCVDSSTKQNYNQLARVEGDRIKFEAERVGTYTLTLTSADEDKNPATKEFTIEVKDTLAPVIELKNSSGGVLQLSNNVYTMNPISESAMWSDDKQTSAKEITGIPTATISDAEPDNALSTVSFEAEGRMTIATPNKDTNGVNEFVYNLNGEPIDGTTDSLKLSRNGNTFAFTPFGTDFRGTYTITYSGSDMRGLSATSKTVKVTVGDTTKPEIYLTDSFKKLLSDGFVLGETDTLTFDRYARIKGNTEDYNKYDLYIWDNLGFAYKTENDKKVIDTTLEKKLVDVYITDPSGNVMTKEDSDDASKTTYKFTTAGEYTMTFTVYDATGSNKGTITQKFVVKAKSTESVDTSTIVGTVLIVVSALILAGIIIYLVRGVKLLPKKNKKASKKASKKTDDKVE